MRQRECVHCGDAVVIADPGEQIVDGETPVEHLERTGHTHVREPRPMACEDCGNIWMTQSGAEHPTCPNCRGKRTKPAE